jgi:nucleoside-diphosphate-sugar epimerase
VAATPKKARFVLASSISVYGKKLATVPADEKTAVRPDSPYSRRKLAAEEAVTKGNRNAVILRIGTVYGPGFEDYYRILSMIERGKMSLFGKGDNRISFVHVEDVVKAIAASIKPKVMPGIYVLAGESLPQKEIYAIAAEQLGVQVPRRTVHVPFALFFTWVEEHKARFGKRRPKLTAEHVHILASDRTFDCAKARKMLGFKPRPLEEGISEMVNEIRKK